MPFDRAFTQVLQKRQRALQILQGGPSSGALLSAGALNPSSPNWLASLKVLGLPATLEDEQDLRGWGKVISRATSLVALLMNVRNIEGGVWLTDDVVFDTADGPGLINKELFSAIAPFGSRPPLRLSSLA